MAAAVATPVVVDMGKQKSKDLRALKSGSGPLMHDVTRIVEEVRAKSPELANKELVPVVVLYRKKPKRGSMMPFSMMK